MTSTETTTATSHDGPSDRERAQFLRECPRWCTEHYDGGEQNRERNHSSFPETVNVVEVYTGQPRELGLWLERRDCRDTGSSETVGVLEVRLLSEDVELAPDQMRRLAAKLQVLADQADRPAKQRSAAYDPAASTRGPANANGTRLSYPAANGASGAPAEPGEGVSRAIAAGQPANACANGSVSR
jgi:hypothetical protein